MLVSSKHGDLNDAEKIRAFQTLNQYQNSRPSRGALSISLGDLV